MKESLSLIDFLLLTLASARCCRAWPDSKQVALAISGPRPDQQQSSSVLYTSGQGSDDGWELPLDQLEVFPLFSSGNATNRVDLVFFGDGYLQSEIQKLRADAQLLAEDIIGIRLPASNANESASGNGGAFSIVKPLLNIWAVHVPSKDSGIGDHDTPRNTPFGLYRPGPELRGVFYTHPGRVRRLCRYLQETGGVALKGVRRTDDDEGLIMGCDEPILLGNDPLYGGLGGTPTVITASKVNGPMVLRHELGHTLIPVGEEYEGGEVYEGVNADPISALSNGTLSWKHWLTDPHPHGQETRMEDIKVPLQVYPWHNLSTSAYQVPFNSSSGDYPRAMIRISISSIPYASHLNLTMDDRPIAFELYPESIGSKDRAWVEVHLPAGIEGLTGKKGGAPHVLGAALTEQGRVEAEGQGGKMITSMEVIEYGPGDRCQLDENFVGAFPTFAENGSVTIRPTNEYCLMRNVRRTTFCPPCKEGLTLSLLNRVSLIDDIKITCAGGLPALSLALIDFPDGEYNIRLEKLTSSARDQDTAQLVLEHMLQGGHHSIPFGASQMDSSGWYGTDVSLRLPDVVRLEGRPEMRAQTVMYFSGC